METTFAIHYMCLNKPEILHGLSELDSKGALAQGMY